MKLYAMLAAGAVAGFFFVNASAQDAGIPPKDTLEGMYAKRPYSPYAGGAVPNRG
jgi:hypothetical protein